MKSRPTFRYTFIGQRHDRLVSHNIKQTEANSDADLSYSKTRTKHAPQEFGARLRQFYKLQLPRDSVRDRGPHTVCLCLNIIGLTTGCSDKDTESKFCADTFTVAKHNMYTTIISILRGTLCYSTLLINKHQYKEELKSQLALNIFGLLESDG